MIAEGLMMQRKLRCMDEVWTVGLAPGGFEDGSVTQCL